MAHANKRITVILAIVAFLFILTIILLIIPYKAPTYSDDPGESFVTEAQKGKEESISSTSTVSTSTKILEVRSTSSLTSLTTTESLDSNDTSVTSDGTSVTTTDQAYINDTTSELTDENSNTTYFTKSTDDGRENDTSDVTESSESTDTSSETESSQIYDTEITTDNSNETTYTSYYDNTSSSEHTAYDNENSTLSTIYSTDNMTTETTLINTNVTEAYTSESSSSDMYTSMNVTTTMKTSQTSEISTTTSVESTSASIEETTSFAEDFNVNTCETAVCKQLAARMVDLMNHSVDPCQDFYQYSCGNGVDNPYLSQVNPMDAAMNRIKEAVLSSNPDNQAHVLYDSCMDKKTPSLEERIAYIQELVLDLGEIDPRLEMKENESSAYDYIDARPFNFTQILAKMMKQHFTPLFDLTLDVDDRNTSRFILRLTPPLFHSPLTEDIREYTCLNQYYEEMNKKSTNDLDELYDTYKECSKEGKGIDEYTKSSFASVNKIGLLKNFSVEYQNKIKTSLPFEVSDVYAEAVLELFPDQNDLRLGLINREYTLYTLQEMDNGNESEANDKSRLQSKIFSWHGLVEELLNRTVNSSTTSVQVYFPEQLAEVLELLESFIEEGPGRLRNVLLALWSQYLDSNLIEPLGHTSHTEEYCLRLVTDLLPDVTTQLYLNSFDRDILNNQMGKVKYLTKLVKDKVMSRFSDTSNDLIVMIQQKLDSMKFDIGEELLEGYQDFIGKLPKGELNKEDFPRNVFQLQNRYRHILYSLEDENPNDSLIMWLQSNLPYYTSGSTSYPLNTVLIPIGSVESPFYEQEGPDFINFAGLGKMISHEMMHAFDSTGIRYELKNAQNLLTSSKQCQNEQLSNTQTFIINDVSMKATLPADLILNEALSDSSAVQLAWEAYRSTLNDETHHRNRRAAKGRQKIGRLTDLSETHRYDKAPNFDVLPFLDPIPIKQFYIRSAQIHCEKTSTVNLLHLKEKEHLHSSLRVNHMARNDLLFQQAFECPNNSSMKKNPQCSYIPLNDS